MSASASSFTPFNPYQPNTNYSKTQTDLQAPQFFDPTQAQLTKSQTFPQPTGQIKEEPPSYDGNEENKESQPPKRRNFFDEQDDDEPIGDKKATDASKSDKPNSLGQQQQNKVFIIF